MASFGAYSLEELAAKLDPPRIVLIYVTHGDATEDVCRALRPILQSSDIVADCGNSDWRDSRRRHTFFKEAFSI